MKPLICRSILWMGMLALVALLPVSAQQPPATAAAGTAEIEVTSVKFNSIRVPNSPSAWYEVEIDLNAKPSTPSTRFLNRVKITLNLGTKVGTPGSKTPFEFYRSSAELAAVETGKATVRFYLPPEVIKRDQARGEPDFWFIDLSVGGTAVPVTKNSASSSISDKAKLDSFKSKVSSEGGANDGILVPQYLSPFAYDTSRQSPAFVRTEGNR